MQTIWHDENGRVQAVYDGDTTSTVWADRGYSKASSDPDKVGSLTRYHVVSVSDGVVTSATYDPLPPTDTEWRARISATRYDHETKGTTFTHSDGNAYGIATDRQSQALTTGAAVQARRAQEAGNTSWSKRWKTASGFVSMNADDILAMGDAVDAHVQACFDRESDLLMKVEDGTITEDDLTQGWP